MNGVVWIHAISNIMKCSKGNMKVINFPGRIKGEAWEQDYEFSCSGISYVCVRVTVNCFVITCDISLLTDASQDS